MLKKSTLCRAWQTERCPLPRKPPPSWSPELGLLTRRGDCPGSPEWAERNRQGLHKGGGKVKAKSWRHAEAAGSLSHRARRRSAWGGRSRRRSGVPPEPPGGSQPPARSFPDPLESSDLGSERANPGGFKPGSVPQLVTAATGRAPASVPVSCSRGRTWEAEETPAAAASGTTRPPARGAAAGPLQRSAPGLSGRF